MLRKLIAMLVVALVVAAPAEADTGFFVGLSDDGLKYDSARSSSVGRSLGVSAFRVTLRWTRGETEPSATDRVWLDRALAAAAGTRVVLSVYGTSGDETPVDDASRDQFCGYVRSALARYPQINDVVIGNEVNKSFFWKPQFNADGSSAAPAAYAALLARCYDLLHAFRPSVNVLTSTSSRGNDNPQAASNISHSPGNFIRKLGEAYRASGRSQPLFDTVGHHPYGEHSSERPWRRHPLSTTIGLGDWDKLTQAYQDAFAGTQQPNPGRCVASKCADIWYMELGFQTTIAPEKAALYQGSENSDHPVAASGPGDPEGTTPDDKSLAPDHATQLVDAVRLASCQPHVKALFNFVLRDETDLTAWQSGVLWADGTPKPSFAAFSAVIAEATSGKVDCTRLKGLAAAPPTGSSSGPGATPFPAARTDVPVRRLLWPPARSFNWRNDLWRFRVEAGEDATYKAAIYRVGVMRRGRFVAVKRQRVVTASGAVRLGYLSFVTFARRRLAHGSVYQFEVVLTSRASALRATRRVSPRFTVLRPPPRRR